MARAASTLARDLLSLAVLLAAAAGLLRALDVLPQILGEPAGGRPFAQVTDVERRLGERLARPAYFPQTLQWPPSRIRLASGRPAAVLLAFTPAGGGPERLFLGQTVGGVAPLPARLWPGGVVLDTDPVELGGAAGVVERVLGEDGRVWHEVRWEHWGRLLAVRSAGSREELLTLARSMRREGP